MLNKRLKELRIKHELSQREVSEKLNIAQTTYAGYETGNHEPSLKTLTALADLYGVSLDYLTGRY